MCGIVGYIGRKSVLPVLVSGLKRLEYRGYDSAGVAVIVNDKVQQLKVKGKLSALSGIIDTNPLDSKIGIGHTRWATHGAPSDINAHPHGDCKDHICLVHNGIIENYQDLKAELMEKGHIFRSETDTEVLVHLIEEYYENDLLKAVFKTLKRVEGSYAIGVISSYEPDRIIAARKDSPLVIGIGSNEAYIASDIPAFLPYTKKVKFIKDEEVVLLTQDDVKIFDMDGNAVEREVVNVHWDSAMAEKAGYKHFMLKEIFEQPRVVQDFIGSKLKENDIHIEEMHLSNEQLRNVKKIIITACGTAYHAGLIGKYFLETFARIPVEIDVASELRYRMPVIDQNTLILAISQSGETADTLASFRDAINNGAESLAITNVVGSSLTRETDNIIYTRAGLEIGVAATKTFTAQVLAMLLLAMKMGLARGKFEMTKFQDLCQCLHEIPEKIQEVLKQYEKIRTIARKYHKCNGFIFLGRHISYPVALEGALKLKEISYIHAEGYAAGEMKHGPIALIDHHTPVVSILPRGHVYEKIISNVKEVKARSAVTIGIVNDDNGVHDFLDEVVVVPVTNFYLTPVISTIPLQLLAYFIADRKFKDVDQPRNLAKSVTVE
jgi:glutamine---fructose-6-phosphate transaminase (isomerizing)